MNPTSKVLEESQSKFNGANSVAAEGNRTLLRRLGDTSSGQDKETEDIGEKIMFGFNFYKRSRFLYRILSLQKLNL